MMTRQDLANANYLALVEEQQELSRKIAAAFTACGAASGMPDTENTALQKRYDAVIVQLASAEEECRQAEAAVISADVK